MVPTLQINLIFASPFFGVVQAKARSEYLEQKKSIASSDGLCSST